MTPTSDRFFWLRVAGKVPLTLCIVILILLALLGPQFYGDRLVPADVAFLDWLQHIIPPQLGQLLRWIYMGTGAKLTAVLVLISLGILVWRRLWPEAQYLAVASLGILLIIDQVLKPLFNRRRPLESLVEVHGRSFPSGHAAGSVVFYFYLASLLALYFPRYQRSIFLVATVWIGLIGLSSMYCRVHWASDIVVGYAVGYVWLVVTLTLLKKAKAMSDKKSTGGVK